MAALVDPYSSLNGASAASTSAAAGATSGKPGKSNAFEAGSAERFLKLLVTQMQNQDPLNPADNAQITSQMAQINTVSGIETLNATVAGLNGRFVQMQALQGAALVGRDITVPGDKFAFSGDAGIGGFDLAGTADRVKVEVLSGAGRVVDTIELGSQTPGLNGFEWKPVGSLPAAGDGYRFRVVATNGTAAVAATPLMRDRVQAVSTSGDKLLLETLVSGRIDYSSVRAVGG